MGDGRTGRPLGAPGGALALGLVACLTFGALAAPSGAATARTVVHVVAPWQANGHAARGRRVVSLAKGSCWTESVAVAGEYRCLSGNGIYDPCFVRPRSRGRQVGCLFAPWARGIHVLALTKRLPRVERPRHLTSTRFAWAIQLSNREACLLGQGTNSLIGKRVMYYYCDKGAAGEIDRSREPWRSEYSRSGTRGPLVAEAVLQAWY